MGDRLGRRATLLWTVGIMGIATGAIGLLPTYARPAGSAPSCWSLLRIAQGLSLGGEWGGSILLATEHSGPRQARVLRRDPAARLAGRLDPVGRPLHRPDAMLPAEELVAWGWRIPFLSRIPLLLVSLYLRWSITETPVFEDVVAENRRDRVPLLTMFRSAPAPSRSPSAPRSSASARTR